MTQYTIVQEGPSQFTIDPVSQAMQVTVKEEVVQINLEQSAVVINQYASDLAEPDVDFLLAYQLSKL